MINDDITKLILINLPIQKIVKFSSISKLFYKISNNSYIWKEKLIYDFGHKGIFTIPENNDDYKEIYKKYYWICTQSNTLLSVYCFHKRKTYLQMLQIIFDTKHITKYVSRMYSR